jgi:GTP-binding protein
MFTDRVRIWAQAGNGGHGCCSFRREKFVPRGGPDGGDGGKGGSVILRVDAQINNLNHLSYRPHHFAKAGKDGAGRLKTGASGKDVILKVPPGTCVYRLPTTDENFERAINVEEADLVADLTQEAQEFFLCAGGKGGLGNSHFKSSTNRAPRKFQKGEPGEKGQFFLELKSIADVGLVGFPNAGKSSLLRALSAAKPKVAAYPFTTLTPMVGVVELEDMSRLTAADIPGLIEGASEGVGLGHDFLRHIERCRILLFVLDMAGTEGRHPSNDYAQLRKELDLYQKELSNRPFLVAANKMDLPEAGQFLYEFQKSFNVGVIPVSAQNKDGLTELKSALAEKMS